MRQPEEIRERIIRLESERFELMADYEKAKGINNQNLIAAIIVERAICIKHLKWVLEE